MTRSSNNEILIGSLEREERERERERERVQKAKKEINFCFFIFKEMRLVEYSVCLVVIGYVLGRVCKEKKIKENKMEKKKV